MAGTRLVKAIKEINREDVAYVANAAVGGFSLTAVANVVINQYLPTVANGLTWASNNYIGASALIGGLSVDLFRALNSVRNGVAIDVKKIVNIPVTMVAAEVVDVAYTSLNSYLDRTPEAPEVWAVKSLGVGAVAAGLRFAGEKAATLSIFKKKPAVDNPAAFQALLNNKATSNNDEEAQLDKKEHVSTSPRMIG